MRRQGIGVTELARRAGKASHRHFSDVLRGKYNPSPSWIQDAADALGEPLVTPAVPERTYQPRGVQ